MKRALFPLIRLWRIAIYRWALREMHPMHPDLPRVVLALAWWEAAGG